MAAVLQSNPILKLSAGVAVFIVVVFIINMATNSTSAPSSQVQQKTTTTVIEKPNTEALTDTTSETLRALTAQVQNLRDVQSNEREVNEARIKELEEELLNKPSNSAVDYELINELVEEKVKQRLEAAAVGNSSNVVNDSIDNIFAEESTSTSSGNDVSLDGFVIGDESVGGQEEYEWITPVGDGTDSEGTFLDGIKDTAQGSFDLTKEIAGSANSKINKIQYATIDKEAILYDAVVLTDLMGVVASSSSVKSPFNFKLELSEDNLATSGIPMPHLAEVRMSGYAVGEWVDSCVQGIITSATFVFKDGTIHNLEVAKSEGEEGNAKQIGYITDQYGKPCIKGEKYSDLAEYAAITGGLSTFAGIANGIANAQYSTVTGSDSVGRVFDGDEAKAMLGQGFSDGTAAASQVIAARYKDIRDLIIAPAGEIVTVHLTTQLNIDYDPVGRKVLNANFEQELQEYYENEERISNY